MTAFEAIHGGEYATARWTSAGQGAIETCARQGGRKLNEALTAAIEQCPVHSGGSTVMSMVLSDSAKGALDGPTTATA
jgi:hypothetical protein